jgi:WD40 repeat protein
MRRSLRVLALVVAIAALAATAAPPAVATLHSQPHRLFVTRWVPLDLPYPDEGDGDLWLSSFTGRPLVRFTHTPHIEEAPGGWSHDGRFLAYEAGRTYACDVWVMRRNGTDPRQVSTGAGDDSSPRFSADGKWISWLHSTGNSSLQTLRLAHPDGTDRHDVPLPSTDLLGAVWSPVGGELAVSMVPPGGGDSEMYTVRPDGSDLTRLTDNLAWEQIEDWSPDGRLLLYSRDVIHENKTVQKLGTLRPDGTHRRTLVDGFTYDARYAPGGARIFYGGPGANGWTALWTVGGHIGVPRKVYSFTGHVFLGTHSCG